MDAYILVTCEKGKETDVFKKMNEYEEVVGTHIIFGEWDVMIKVKMESPEELGTFILDKIRPLPGVLLTSTLIVAK